MHEHSPVEVVVNGFLKNRGIAVNALSTEVGDRGSGMNGIRISEVMGGFGWAVSMGQKKKYRRNRVGREEIGSRRKHLTFGMDAS